MSDTERLKKYFRFFKANLDNENITDSQFRELVRVCVKLNEQYDTPVKKR